MLHIAKSNLDPHESGFLREKWLWFQGPPRVIALFVIEKRRRSAPLPFCFSCSSFTGGILKKNESSWQLSGRYPGTLISIFWRECSTSCHGHIWPDHLHSTAPKEERHLHLPPSFSVSCAVGRVPSPSISWSLPKRKQYLNECMSSNCPICMFSFSFTILRGWEETFACVDHSTHK